MPKYNKKFICISWKSETEKQIIKKLINNSDAIWVQNIPTKILLGLIKYARALLQPSKVEGFGLPPLEALLVGTIPIVSDIPVFREILHSDSALFFKLNNMEDYINKIKIVLNDKTFTLLKNRILRKRQTTIDRYSDKNIYKTWLHILKELKKYKSKT